MKLILARFLIGVLLLTAGCNQCENDQPPDYSLRFKLVSPTGQNLIGLAATQYPPSSISVTYQSQPFDFEVVESFNDEYAGALSTRCCLDKSGQARLLLQLTSTDTDTIDITYRTKEGRCARIIEYTKVEYNLRPMVTGEYNAYSFIKR